MNDGPEWFAPKRYGYGAGWPIAWQGWAVLIGFAALMIGIELVFGERRGVALAIAAPIILLFLLIVARTTRGRWRWRWGEPEN